jgi:uncharacterized protein with HEPN domain
MSAPRRADIHLELALRALRRVPVFLAGIERSVYLEDELRQAAVERQ